MARSLGDAGGSSQVPRLKSTLNSTLGSYYNYKSYIDIINILKGLRPTAGRRPREAVVVVVVVVVTAVVLFLLLSWSLLQVWTLYVLLLLQDWVLVPLLTFVTLLTPRIDGEAVGF